MTQNAEEGPVMAGPPQKNCAVAGTDSMPQCTDDGHQEGLFPGDGEPPIVRPIALATRGRVEFTGKCPCGSWHRHVHLGRVVGPCGTEYRLMTRTMQGAA